MIWQIFGYGVIGLASLGLLCIALAERAPVIDDCPCDVCRPKEPANLPGAIVVHLSLGDRLGDLEKAKGMIRKARRHPDGYEVEAVRRQIESQG